VDEFVDALRPSLLRIRFILRNQKNISGNLLGKIWNLKIEFGGFDHEGKSFRFYV
jgi:hypothetical protein